MNTLCLRCGNEVREDKPPTLHKCVTCENIRFNREFFYPLERKIIQNFQEIKKTIYGLLITGLYQFGSFSDGKSKCGDIDYIVTYNEAKIKEIIDNEINLFHSYFELIYLQEDSISIPKSSLINGFWDFKTCNEYPDCLSCFGSRGCNIPDTDYSSHLHTYCEDGCKKKRKYPIPSCSFSECYLLNGQIKERILKDIYEILTEGDIDFTQLSSDLKIKVIDIIIKNSTDSLKEEFDFMKIAKTVNFIQIF